jgi:putative membrane protein
MDGEPGRADADSRARTHLANERTFLAWLRTGVTLIALAVAAAQLLPQDTASGVPLTRVLATGVLVTGVAIVGIGMDRYSRGRERIDHEGFLPASRSVAFAAVMAIAVGLASVGLIWLLPR